MGYNGLVETSVYVRVDLVYFLKKTPKKKKKKKKKGIYILSLSISPTNKVR